MEAQEETPASTSISRRKRKRKRPVRKRRRRISRVTVPSFFTLMNLLCGFGAITSVFEGRIEFACWLIVFASFFDMLDGMMARLTNSVSMFGVELDSLSDIVSFGVAPSFLMYVSGLNELGLPGLFLSALPTLCGAVRLARFNLNVELEGDKPPFFTGLPIPAQAAAIVALILNLEELSWIYQDDGTAFSLLIPYVIILAGLMVSTIPFDVAPKPTTAYIRKHPLKFLAALVGVGLIIIFQKTGLLIASLMYLGAGLANAGIQVFRALQRKPEAPADSTVSSSNKLT